MGDYSVCLSMNLGTNMFIQITDISLLPLYQFYKQLRTQQLNKMVVSEGTEMIIMVLVSEAGYRKMYCSSTFTKKHLPRWWLCVPGKDLTKQMPLQERNGGKEAVIILIYTI
jgi:hypothetical protein